MCRPSTGWSTTRSRISRMSSMPRCEAASISTTSSEVPFAIATQAWHVLSGVGVGPLRAVQRLGEDARERRLAGAARAREQVGLAHLPCLDRVPQRPDDRLLAHDLVEVLRPVLAVERGHGGAADCTPLGEPPGRQTLAEARVARSRTLLRGRVRAGAPDARSSQVAPRHLGEDCLALLPPGPDAVRRLPVRGTWPSTLTSASPCLGRRPLERGFSPAKADCGFREPLAPHLARPGTTMVAHEPHGRLCRARTGSPVSR